MRQCAKKCEEVQGSARQCEAVREAVRSFKKQCEEVRRSARKCEEVRSLRTAGQQQTRVSVKKQITDSWKASVDGEIMAIIVVLQLPPRLSSSSRVIYVNECQAFSNQAQNKNKIPIRERLASSYKMRKVRPTVKLQNRIKERQSF